MHGPRLHSSLAENSNARFVRWWPEGKMTLDQVLKQLDSDRCRLVLVPRTAEGYLCTVTKALQEVTYIGLI